MVAEQWYYRIDGQAHGPFTVIQFDKLVRGKTVTSTTDVSMDGQTWRPYEAVLKDLLADSPPPTAAPDSAAPEWMTAQTLIHQAAVPPGGVPAADKNPSEQEKLGGE